MSLQLQIYLNFTSEFSLLELIASLLSANSVRTHQLRHARHGSFSILISLPFF
jgi:hypothetical protein